MISKETQLFEDYNKLIEDTFNELISGLDEDNLYKLSESLVSQSVRGKETVWQKEVKPFLDGLTPEEFISGIKDEGELLKLFEEAATTCDREIPGILTKALINGGEKVINRLLEIALDTDYRRDSENVAVAVAAISVLGNTKRIDVLERLLALLMECTEDDALIMESISEAILQCGAAGVNTVCDKISEQENIDFRAEYLVMILPQLVKDKKSDEVYKLLKSSFQRMGNKILGASALAEYGDGRAVPALRGFLEKQAKNLNRETFFEIKKAIEQLGGNIEGLVLPNFTNNNNPYGLH